MADTIRVGDCVRSFDFALGGPLPDLRDLTGPEACYAEGVVTAIGRFRDVDATCDRYQIRVSRRVVAGEELPDAEPYVYPPLNGLDIAGMPGRRTSGVVLIER